MIRGLPTTIACACLAGAVGIGLFFIKHEVKEQEARLGELNHEIQANQEAMHVLKAEWSYLNDPARLRALSEKHLSMKVMGPSQIASLDTLPAAAPVYASARPAAPAIARVEASAPAIVTAVAAKPAATVAEPKAMAKAATKPAAAPTKLAAAPAPVKAAPAAAVAAARPALVPGADTTPRLAAAPVSAPMPAVSAPAQRGPAAPVRNIVIQSPALASTPALPGEVR